MRKHFYLSLFLFLILSIWTVRPAFTAQSANVCYPPLASLTGWWPGNGSPDDVIGGRDAVLHDDATTGPGLIGQAFVLDGDGDFLEIPHDPALNPGTGDFAVALWVNFDNTTGEQVLVEQWIQRSSAPPNPSEGWTLTKLEDNVLRLAMSSGTDTDTNVDSAPLTIPTDTWIHFVATRQAGQVTLFTNGQPVASGLYAGTLDSTASLKFGHRGNPNDTPGSEDENGYFLNGRLDGVQLFVGRALPQESITAIHNAGSLGQCAAVVTSAPSPQPPTAELLYPHLTGAFIELQAEPLQPDLWTRIQWQDAFGNWHDIEGWQGSFNPDQRVLWYVGAEQLGDGPFRWLVYESQGGDLLAVSDSFHLPSRGGEVLHVEVSLAGSVEMGASFAQTLDEDGDASEAGVPTSSASWLRVHPTRDSVDAWNWPQAAVLHLTIDDPATLASPDFEMQMPGEVDPDLGSVWFDFASMYDLKPGDEVTLSDGTTTRQLIVSSLKIDAVDVAANTASGTAEVGASVRLPAPPPPDNALFVTADSLGTWFADFHDIGFDLVAGTTVIAEVYDEDGDLTLVEWATVVPLAENVAAARPVVVTTNGVDDDRENPGIEPADITDGRLDYLAAGDALDDGVVGYVNDDLNQPMVITVTIDLQGTYDVSNIRYNMGDVQRADTWNADLMTTPFGTTPTNPGTPGHGAWTEHTGSATLSSVTIVLEKTRVSFETDWLFIGEIQVYGVPSGS
jgi:hypothetical protein